MATGVFGRDDESAGIPNFVGPDELRPKVALPNPPPVIDIASLATALRAIYEYTHPVAFDPQNFVSTLTTSSVVYVKVVEWIPKAPGGVLKEISMTSDPNAQYRLVVSNKEMFKDIPLQAALTLDYKRMRVPGVGDKPITLYIKSPTAVSITVSGVISGEQILAPSV